MELVKSTHPEKKSCCDYCKAPVGKPSFINGNVFRLYKMKEGETTHMACIDCLIQLRKKDSSRYIPQEYPAAI